MNVLIIGSKGFIGSHCSRLMSQHYRVWCCDIVNDYVSTNYFQADATNSDFKEVFRWQQFDVCINCSGAANVQHSFEHPLKDFMLNTYNVVKILEAIKELQPSCKFINCSSAAVYGNPASLPVSESSALQPLSPYGLHKKHTEELVSSYSTFFNLKTCSIRLFSVYGPGLEKQLFWDLHAKIQQSGNIELYGTGSESRDFLYVEDIANALTCVLENTAFRGECINVSGGDEITIRKAVELFQSLYFAPFEFVFGGEQRPGDPNCWKADVSLLHSMGFQAQTDMAEGLTRYIKWLSKEKN